MAFIDQDEFEAMKTLSGRRAPRCDTDQFRADMSNGVVDNPLPSMDGHSCFVLSWE